MGQISKTKRIRGWIAFDFATQPYYTLGLTFIFGPYFAAVATSYYAGLGMSETVADARAQSIWSLGQTIAGLVVAFTAPILGILADRAGRKIPYIAFFSLFYFAGAWSMWLLTPDGSTLILVLVLFYVGFIAGESMLNFVNAFLPALGDEGETGSISGTGASIGYVGGVISLFIMLLFLAENETGQTLIGLEPLFGLDPDAREGTRSVGPVIAIWFAVFMVPFFLYVRDEVGPKMAHKVGSIGSELKVLARTVIQRRSLGAFLLSSMLYRDSLNALYAYGGVYATLVLNWSIIQIGVFGIVGAITAAVVTFLGGQADKRFGPKPVIIACILALITVSTMMVGMSREMFFGVPLAEDSSLPDIVFYVCGAIIGGCGGAIYAASRSMMVRHTDPARPAEAFGLFALSGKATAFLAPALITLFTWWLQDPRLGFIPVIFLFLLGLLLLVWVNKNGDRAEWSAPLSPQPS